MKERRKKRLIRTREREGSLRSQPDSGVRKQTLKNIQVCVIVTHITECTWMHKRSDCDDCYIHKLINNMRKWKQEHKNSMITSLIKKGPFGCSSHIPIILTMLWCEFCIMEIFTATSFQKTIKKQSILKFQRKM